MTGARRLFLAIELPNVLRAGIGDAIQPLVSEAPELSWTPGQNRHITMKFLGDVGRDRVERITSMMDDIARTHRPFSIHLARVGAFPNFRKARVVWLGVEPEPRFELLQHDLELAADAVGFELEARVFRPHVTLARLTTPMDVDRARRLARAARKVDFSASVDVAELTLFESTLAPTGARHSRMDAATLGGR